METTLYDESSRTSMKKMKLEMSLDLQAGDPRKTMKQAKFSDVLATPDLGLFMLTSPDLEKFLMQQNGMILTTPTPTTQILFPKSVTEEQEAYARGFVDALGELHKNFGKPLANTSTPATTTTHTNTALNLTSQVDQKPQLMVVPITQQITTQVPPAAVYTTLRTSKPSTRAANQRIVIHQSFQPKVEVTQSRAQTVTKSSIPAPVNLDYQEEVKIERKRARNRLAATKCRNRKLERISRLEDRVAELKQDNQELDETAAALREQVYRLKQSIIEHTSQGCQVVINHDLL